MENLELLLNGLEIALTWQNIIYVLIGVFLGTTIGMLPGIGPVNAIAVLFPIVYSLGVPSTTVIILFAGIYYGSQYGNSISSILINVPGTSSAAVTAIDGHIMAKQGKAGKALATAAISSFIGGTISIFFLIIFAPLLAEFAIKFGSAEYTVLLIFAFIALASFNLNSLPKSIISALLGLLIASIGIDATSGVTRLTFGVVELEDGIDFILVVIGFFAVSELIFMLTQTSHKKKQPKIEPLTSLHLNFTELVKTFFISIRQSISGFIIGVLPGAGGTIASFIAYAVEKKIIKKNNFGKGDFRGVAAPESANNAASVGSFIPLLILGVPGSETTAVMLGGLISFGIAPGPLLMENNPEIFWGLAASMFLGNLFLILLNLPFVGLFARILKTPNWLLMPIIGMLTIVGAYTVNGSSFDVLLIIIFGILGYIMRRANFPLAPLVLGVVLGSLIETNIRRSLLYSQGSIKIFFESPISLTLIGMAILAFIFPYFFKAIQKKYTKNMP